MVAADRFVLFLLPLCLSFLHSKSAVNEDDNGADGPFSPHVISVLKYLNSNPERIYTYNRGEVIRVDNKVIGEKIKHLTIAINISLYNFGRYL